MSEPANGSALTWAELDELADYAAGVLSGAPAERIAELLRTDERWAAAHAALVAAEPVVRTALHAAATIPPSLPDDVAARLEAALGDARTAARPAGRLPVGPGPAAPRPGAAGPPSRPRAAAASVGPGRSRRPLLS